MKIGIVCPYNLFRHGGVQEAVWAHQRYLDKRGHDVSIITPCPRGFSSTPEYKTKPEFVKFLGHSTDLNYPFKTKADISMEARTSEVKDFLAKEQFDILHFHEPWVPMFSTQLLWQSEAINIATFHAKWPESWLYKTLGKVIHPYAVSVIERLDAMVAASEPASHYVRTKTGKAVPIILNGIDLSLYDPKNTQRIKKYDDGIKNIVYINRLEKRKGPDLLLKAYRELVKTNKNVRLLIASDGDMRDKLERFVALHELPNVEFLGFVSEKEKIQLYTTADVYTAPSPYGEGFGIVLLEAMAMGAPYIAGDNVGYRYASGNRADDYLVDPTDSAAYALKLQWLLNDTQAQKDFKKWAAGRIGKFDYNTIVEEYEHIYKTTTKKSKPTRRTIPKPRSLKPKSRKSKNLQ